MTDTQNPEGPKTPVSSKTSVKGCSDDYKELIEKLQGLSSRYDECSRTCSNDCAGVFCGIRRGDCALQVEAKIEDQLIQEAITTLTSQGERIAELEGCYLRLYDAYHSAHEEFRSYLLKSISKMQNSTKPEQKE
ncbi:hypothetical protein [Litorimonas sp.]|uniref:hypothetical protein n=1 Tax=Litorimonas sp. TaxID=1892381 RepID=UPI003A8AFE6F